MATPYLEYDPVGNELSQPAEAENMPPKKKKDHTMMIVFLVLLIVFIAAAVIGFIIFWMRWLS